MTERSRFPDMKRTVLMFLATLVAGLVIARPNASAQGAGGTLRLGVTQCPDGYSGVNYFADCVEPASGIEFTIGTPNTDNTKSGVSRNVRPSCRYSPTNATVESRRKLFRRTWISIGSAEKNCA